MQGVSELVRCLTTAVGARTVNKGVRATRKRQIEKLEQQQQLLDKQLPQPGMAG
jgi:hypothetical protein